MRAGLENSTVSGSGKFSKGFTLVELLVTLAMIAVLVVVTLPPIFKAARDREVRHAAQDVLDAIEFAKVQAAGRYRAYEVELRLTTNARATEEDPGLQGQILVHEGPSSACLNFPNADPEIGWGVRIVNPGWDYPSVHVVDTVPQDLTGTSLCVKPDGRVLRTDTQMPIVSGNALYAAGDAQIVLQRYEGNDTPMGVQNVVVVPFNGAARVTWR